jgi:hypothetical protein
MKKDARTINSKQLTEKRVREIVREEVDKSMLSHLKFHAQVILQKD